MFLGLKLVVSKKKSDASYVESDLLSVLGDLKSIKVYYFQKDKMKSFKDGGQYTTYKVQVD